MKIRWPKSISNEELQEKYYQLPIANGIRRRKWYWIGHTLRKASYERGRQAMESNPQGSRQRQMSWKRSLDVETDLEGAEICCKIS